MSAIPQPSLQKATVLVVAGEPSSDHHGAEFVKALRHKLPGATIFGMGGSHMRREGVETVVDSERAASVMGLTELFGSLREIIRAFKTLEAEIERRRPDVAVLIDYPDFNLRLARVLKRRGVKVLYYISPQLWAWRRGRIHQIQKCVDRMAVIFPFEAEFYREHRVPVQYVGHPFLDEPWPVVSREEFLRSVGVPPSGKLVAFLPGSRKGEVERLLSPLVGAFDELRRDNPELHCVVPMAPGLESELFQPFHREGLHFIRGRARELLTVADVAVVTSGTATVEAALSRVPFVVVYRMSALTYRIARLLVRGVKHFAMANLIAGEKIVEEILQDQVTPSRVASELRRLLNNDLESERLRERLGGVRTRLERGREGGESAAAGAAAMACELLSEARR